jgi:hypothetical protein
LKSTYTLAQKLEEDGLLKPGIYKSTAEAVLDFMSKADQRKLQ